MLFQLYFSMLIHALIVLILWSLYKQLQNAGFRDFLDNWTNGDSWSVAPREDMEAPGFSPHVCPTYFHICVLFSTLNNKLVNLFFSILSCSIKLIKPERETMQTLIHSWWVRNTGKTTWVCYWHLKCGRCGLQNWALILWAKNWILCENWTELKDTQLVSTFNIACMVGKIN